MALALMEKTSCRALCEIREILKDDSLDDPTCFHRIEHIVEVYESIELDGGGRHDFG